MSLDNLPVEWLSLQLKDIGNIYTGKTPSSKDTANFAGDIPFVKPGDLDDGGYIFHTSTHISSQALAALPNLPANSVMVTCIGNMGKVGITTEVSATNQQINSIVPFKEFINYKYIYYYCLTLKNWLDRESSATTIAIVNKGRFSEAPIPLSPLAEQREIVRQLDIMLAQVEQIKARLDAIPAILKKFRQSVLADAVSGKLIDLDFNTLPLESFSDYLTDVRYGTSKKCFEDLIEAVPVLRIPNINDDGSIDFDNLKYADFDAKEIEQLRLIRGDLLLIRSNGSLDLVGKSAIADELDRVMLYAGYLIRLRFNDSVNPQFIQYFLQAPQTRQIIENIARSTSGVNNINSKEIANLKIRLPIIDVQNDIVVRVKQLLTFSKKIEETVKFAQKRVNLLTQSILAKAFSGELTAEWRELHQDLITGVNSAEALLTKIQAEREASKPVKKTRKKKEA